MTKMENWDVIVQDDVKDWLATLDLDDANKIYSTIGMLMEHGHRLGRPYVDTLRQSKYPNMKELRIQSKLSVFRLFFIFDPLRLAIILCGGDKKGKNEKLFYTTMIAKAEQLYELYLSNLQLENK
ncbi:type II toxin-antitoxin system RelE/ParE family toxin [Lonepinella sp. MS14435]|uniref:type II toxin-antitoxin system RelE/ParE family toxin n=1 Tax=Lonepinella sp. MS14435 TaxID=3003618 RepID=UPI0036DDCF6A